MRWEVSRVSAVPLGFTAVLFWPMLIMIKLIAIGTKPVLLAKAAPIVWLALLEFELARRIWTARHRYASPRWLRAVQAVVGDDVAVHALADLVGGHRQEPEYVVTRSEMIIPPRISDEQRASP